MYSREKVIGWVQIHNRHFSAHSRSTRKAKAISLLQSCFVDIRRAAKGNSELSESVPPVSPSAATGVARDCATMPAACLSGTGRAEKTWRTSQAGEGTAACRCSMWSFLTLEDLSPLAQTPWHTPLKQANASSFTVSYSAGTSSTPGMAPTLSRRTSTLSDLLT